MGPNQILVALTTLLAGASAWNAPNYSGYNRVWQASFNGKSGTLPSSGSWNFIQSSVNYNNELQKYTKNKKNVKLSGDGTLQIIPFRDSSAPHGWTSARLESKYTFTPQNGKITRVEGSLRLRGNAASRKQGIWPAFWLLGNSYRNGVKWPGCGEIDIMENINGERVGHVALHCDVSPGGICNEGSGITTTTPLNDVNKYHVWRVEMDRRQTDFKKQSISWSMDGKTFQKITGAQIGNAKVWKTLCQSPFYFVLNVAIGGDWAGAPNSRTLGGIGSAMEVGYVAHYVSK